MALRFSSDKLNTDNPFIDLLLYTMKILVANSVIKDQYSADANETVDSLNSSSLYLACKDNNVTLNRFRQIPVELLKKVGVPQSDIDLYVKSNYDLYYIPKDFKNTGEPSGTTYRKDLLELMIPWYIEKYESYNYSGELNNYYRKILGKPNVGDWGINMRDYEYLLPYDFTYEGTYLHEIGADKCVELDQYGILDVIKADYPDAEYLDYLTAGITPYDARNKLDFQILYTPRISDISFYNTEISPVVFEQFVEEFRYNYERNREYMLTTVYSTAMEVDSEQYHSFMILYTLLITVIDILNEVQSHIVKMDILNRRCVEYIFSMYGVPFYRNVPEKWLEKICKNIHKILKYKSSTQEMLNIKSIFGYESMKINKYYLVKERYTDEMGDFLFNYSEKYICAPNDIVLLEERKEKISSPPPAQPVPGEVEMFDKYGVDASGNVTQTVPSGFVERYIVFPFDYFLQKGNVMFVKVDNYVMVQNTDYFVRNYNRIWIKSSLLSGHTTLTYMFYYDKTTIDEDFYVDKEHALNMVTKQYPNAKTKDFDLSPIKWSNYWTTGNAVMVSVNSLWLSSNQYSIDTNTNILTIIDPNVQVLGQEVTVILLYSKHIRSKYEKKIVKATKQDQDTFVIPDPFPFYTLNENQFFITMGSIIVHPDRYMIYRVKEEGQSYIKFTDHTKVEKGRILEFNFLYSRNAIINKINLSYKTITLKVTQKFQTEFDITYPVRHYATSGYLVFVKYLNWYMPINSYSCSDLKLTLLEDSLALNIGDELTVDLVYINEDRTTKKEDNIVISKAYVVATKAYQKEIKVGLPTKHFDTKYNKIVVDVNGYVLNPSQYTLTYNLEGTEATIVIKERDYRPPAGKRVNFTFFYNMDAEYTINIDLQETPIDPTTENVFDLNFPFYPYLETGHDFIAINGSTMLSKTRIKMLDRFNFKLTNTAKNHIPGRTMVIMYIYNNYYTINGRNRLIVEWKPKSVTDIYGMDDTDSLTIPEPFIQYIEKGWPYFVTYNNRTYLDENKYDVYGNEFYTSPVADLKANKYGETITFTFVYLLREPYVYKAISEDYETDMALKFCKLPIDDLYSSLYLKDKSNYVSYDSIVNDDGWWDGYKYKKDSHTLIKQAIYKEKFNYARSKYYGATQEIDHNTYNMTMAYFYSMLYDPVLLEQDVCISVPTISNTETFRIADIFVFLTCLTYEYNNLPDFVIEWNDPHPYAVGFNFKTTLNAIKHYLYDNHIQPEHYAIWNMIIPTTQIKDLAEFMHIYKTDMSVREYIIDSMMNADSYEEYKIWKYIDETLNQWKLDLSFFKLRSGAKATTYTMFLKDWAPTLYLKLKYIKGIKDESTKLDTIITLVDDIVYILKEFIDSDILEIIVDRFPGQSVVDAIKFMMLFINFYKSYKIQFISSASQNINTDNNGKNTEDNTMRPIDNKEILETFYNEEYLNPIEVFYSAEKMKPVDDLVKHPWMREDFVIKETHK